MSPHFVIELEVVERHDAITRRTLGDTDSEQAARAFCRGLTRWQSEHAIVYVFDRDPKYLGAEQLERHHASEWQPTERTV